MDQQIIMFCLIAAGAIFMLVIPALLKMIEEGQKFKPSYLWGLGVSVVIAAFTAMPEDTVVITFKSGFLLFLAGAGLQGIFNKGNSERIKRVE